MEMLLNRDRLEAAAAMLLVTSAVHFFFSYF